MEIKQISKFDENAVKTVLNNRNIKDLDLFLNPTDEDDTHHFDFAYMEKGIEMLLAHLGVKSKIAIVVDPDADGYMASTILYQYLLDISPDADIEYIMQDEKQHGLSVFVMDQLADEEYDLVLTPDAASNDVEQIKKLHMMGADMIAIDHHEVTHKTEFGVIINNQHEENKSTNRKIVGAGMVLRLCQAIDEVLGHEHPYSEKYFDLAAIGQVGDASDISDNEIRNMVFKGLSNINNEFVKTVLKDQFDDLDNITPRDLSFSIIPLINAVTRLGTQEEKEYLFEALNSIYADRVFTVTKKKKNKTTGKFDPYTIEQNLYERVYDMCTKAKTRQNNLVKKTITESRGSINASGGIAVCVAENIKDRSITGLVANKISSEYKMPALMLFKNEGKLVGSGRGYEKALPSLKDWCEETALTDFAKGHPNAFGISIDEDNFSEFKKEALNLQNDDSAHYVDVLFNGEVDSAAIEAIDEHKYLFGGKVTTPVFGFKNIEIEKSKIYHKGSLFKFFYDDVEFVKFNCSSSDVEDLTHNFDKTITLSLVGTPGINEWNGKRINQIILDDFARTKNTLEEKEVTIENIVF